MYQAGNIAGSNGATRKAIKVRTKYPPMKMTEVVALIRQGAERSRTLQEA
jgi:hypothetical protein